MWLRQVLNFSETEKERYIQINGYRKLTKFYPFLNVFIIKKTKFFSYIYFVNGKRNSFFQHYTFLLTICLFLFIFICVSNIKEKNILL